MKHSLAICFLFPINVVTAQSSYHPMIVEGRIWDLFQVPGEQSICHYEAAGHYFFQGDTLLDGKVYKKLYFHHIRSNPPFPFCGGFYVDTMAVYRVSTFYREDTLARKVYQWRSDETPHELVLYDFSLQAGDTLHYPFQSFPILSVTDWPLANGETRKAFEIGGWTMNYYVEGVGYLMGQFGQVFYPLEGWSEITCMRDGEEVVFSDAPMGGLGCILGTSSIQNPDYSTFSISPNPFSDYLVLKAAEDQLPKSFVFELYDLTGRSVFAEKLDGANEVFNVDLPILPKGIYGWAINGKFQGMVLKW